MVQIVPVQNTGNQVVSAQLDGQPTTLNITQRIQGLFMDVVCPTMVDGGLFGVLCKNLVRVVRDQYFGYDGDFVWLDTQGNENPQLGGLGTRWVLVFLSSDDLPAGEG